MPPANRHDQRAGAFFKAYIRNHKGRQHREMMRRRAAIRARRANPTLSRTFDVDIHLDLLSSDSDIYTHRFSVGCPPANKSFSLMAHRPPQAVIFFFGPFHVSQGHVPPVIGAFNAPSGQKSPDLSQPVAMHYSHRREKHYPAALLSVHFRGHALKKNGFPTQFVLSASRNFTVTYLVKNASRCQSGLEVTLPLGAAYSVRVTTTVPTAFDSNTGDFQFEIAVRFSGEFCPTTPIRLLQSELNILLGPLFPQEITLSILFLLGAVNARFTFVDYLANITVGGQDFTVIVNTGSSVDYVDYPTGIQLQESQWDPSAAVDLCLRHGWLQHKHFNDLSAVSGRQGSPDFRERAALNGPVGFDTVAVGGLEVANQEIAVPNVATFNGHGIVSGLLGLAFPSLIPAVFNVTDGNKLPYDPFFFSAVKQENLKDPSGQNAFRVCRICANNTLLVLSASIDRATVDQLANDTVTISSIYPSKTITALAAQLLTSPSHHPGNAYSDNGRVIVTARTPRLASFVLFRYLYSRTKEGCSPSHPQTDAMDSARGPASPLTETSDVEDDSAPTSPTRLAIREISKSEKRLNKFEDGAGPLLDASKGIITVIKTIGANEEVQMMGKSILSGIPTLMATLKAISTVHPFVASALWGAVPGAAPTPSRGHHSISVCDMHGASRILCISPACWGAAWLHYLHSAAPMLPTRLCALAFGVGYALRTQDR
ncbi:hypothetical protein C8J57DRAFT_1470187 [Mycena rebaudengoi]|nr:hypothetical protein C8J57DRAFT_1470187 [Mycena rebaudengoi]